MDEQKEAKEAIEQAREEENGKRSPAPPPYEQEEAPYLIATRRKVVHKLPGRDSANANSHMAENRSLGQAKVRNIPVREDDTQDPKTQQALEMYDWLESCVFAVVLIVLIFILFLRSATVSGPSMQPTLTDGDRLILQQIGYDDPQYGDIVVVDRTQSGEPPIIKRVIGRAGDVINIDFESGQVWRNDELLVEPYIYDYTYLDEGIAFPVTIPEGTVFVMGDNRNHSLDSRSPQIGMVDLRRIMGKAIFRFFPLHQLGPV